MITSPEIVNGAMVVIVVVVVAAAEAIANRSFDTTEPSSIHFNEASHVFVAELQAPTSQSRSRHKKNEHNTRDGYGAIRSYP
jgi:hypothetical protein